MRSKSLPIVIIVLLLVLALVSAFLVAPKLSAVETHASGIEYLDGKDEAILTLTALSMAGSVAITMLPGDIATPIAEELADLSTYFMIALCAVFLEKYLLTLTCFAAFKFLIPAACLIGIFAIIRKSPVAKTVAVKIACFAIAICLVVPASIGLSKIVENTYGFTLTDTAEYVEDLTDQEITVEEIEGAAEEEGSTGVRNLISQWVEKISNGVEETVHSVTKGVSETVEKMEALLSSMIQKVAIIIVTSCLIPILVLITFIWLANTILNANIVLPYRRKEKRVVQK